MGVKTDHLKVHVGGSLSLLIIAATVSSTAKTRGGAAQWSSPGLATKPGVWREKKNMNTLIYEKFLAWFKEPVTLALRTRTALFPAGPLSHNVSCLIPIKTHPSKKIKFVCFFPALKWNCLTGCGGAGSWYQHWVWGRRIGSSRTELGMCGAWAIRDSAPHHTISHPAPHPVLQKKERKLYLACKFYLCLNLLCP